MQGGAPHDAGETEPARYRSLSNGSERAGVDEEGETMTCCGDCHEFEIDATCADVEEL